MGARMGKYSEACAIYCHAVSFGKFVGKRGFYGEQNARVFLRGGFRDAPHMADNSSKHRYTK